MDFWDFMAVVAATFVGGLLLSAFLWAIWTITRLERSGVKHNRIPLRVYLTGIGPLAFVILVAALLPY